MAKAAFNRNKTFHQQIGLTFKEETNKVPRLESFGIWCWRRMEKISWTDRVRNEKSITYTQGGEKYSYLLIPWSRVLPKKLKRPKLLKKFPAIYETRRLSPYSQEPATCPYPEPD